MISPRLVLQIAEEGGRTWHVFFLAEVCARVFPWGGFPCSKTIVRGGGRGKNVKSRLGGCAVFPCRPSASENLKGPCPSLTLRFVSLPADKTTPGSCVISYRVVGSEDRTVRYTGSLRSTFVNSQFRLRRRKASCLVCFLAFHWHPMVAWLIARVGSLRALVDSTSQSGHVRRCSRGRDDFCLKTDVAGMFARSFGAR